MAKKQPPQSPQSPGNEPAFEDILGRLDQIVHALEEGEIGLGEALAQYEEGVKLLRQSYEVLQRAERRIELLSGVDAEGRPLTVPFDDTATFSPGAEPRPAGAKRRPTEGVSDPSDPCGGVDAPGGLF